MIRSEQSNDRLLKDTSEQTHLAMPGSPALIARPRNATFYGNLSGGEHLAY